MAISFTRKGSDGHFFCQGSLQGKAWLPGAHVCQHPAEDDLADAALAQLQNKVVGLGTPDLSRCPESDFFGFWGRVS